MLENICVAVDACCDLPADFIQQHRIRVLPIYLRFGDEIVTDDRDPGRTRDFYQRGMLEKSVDAETIPVSSEEMSKILEQELVLKYDKVLVITMMSSRSMIYENIRDAVWVSQPKFKDLRSEKGLSRKFRILVMDSNNLFTGPGVLVYEAMRLLRQEDKDIEHVMMQLESLKNRVRTFLLPNDLFHLKNRASNRGEKSDKSVGWLSYQVGNLLNVKPIIMGHDGATGAVDKAMGFGSGLKKVFANATDAIDRGLNINVVTMSYAGELNEIQEEPAYQNFVDFAQTHGVTTLLSPMSTTASINVGPGCFSLSYAD